MKKLIENTTRSPMYHGNTMIPPGESKLVDVPDEAVAEVAQSTGPSLAEQVAELLLKAISAITPELPGLTQEALDLAEDMERAGKNRTTLLAAITAESMDRAAKRLDGGGAGDDDLSLAELDLLTAKNSLAALAPDAAPEVRAAADQAVTDAQAKVDALAGDQG
jgi:hypothetical protein